MTIRVLMNGAMGKMGQAVSAGIAEDPNVEIVGAVDVKKSDVDFGYICGTSAWNVSVGDNLEEEIIKTKPDVVIDFTNPQAFLKNAEIVLKHKIPLIIGTSGVGPEEEKQLAQMSKEAGKPVFVASNFALGAVLMMQYAKDAAKYFPDVEIIERHHDNKLDAPSGTAQNTLKLISEVREAKVQGNPNEFEKIEGSRGGDYMGMKVHSLRLPGYMATQEVVFGGTGQVLTIKHDAFNRGSYVPGVLLSLNKINELEGLVVGLEKLLD